MPLAARKRPLLPVRRTGDLVEYAMGDSRLLIQWTAEGAVRVLPVNRGLAEFIEPIVDRWDATLAKTGWLRSYLDFGEMKVYDSDFRIVLTQWGVKHREKLAPVQMFTRSKIVLMGASIANIALGGLVHIHKNLKSFEAAARNNGLPPRPI